MFWLGLALGLAAAAGIGWLFWNKQKQLRETIARLGGRV